ncbi:MAG TPA: ATP synthase F0 subunit C [Thermodesulfobacteriota bacterium]
MIRRVLLSFAAAVASALVFAPVSYAQAAEAASGTTGGLLALSAGIAIAVAAFGGALGQGRAVAAALDGIARNPSASGKIQTPMIIGLALIESLVIYALVIAFLLQGKI